MWCQAPVPCLCQLCVDCAAASAARRARRRCRGRRGEDRLPRRASRPACARQQPRRRRRDFSAASARRRSPSARARPGTAESWPPSQWTCSPSTCTRGLSIASLTLRPWSTTFATTCMTAPRSRTEPALPSTSRGSPSLDTTDGDIMLVSLVPGFGACPPGWRSYSPSMLFMWMPVPGTTTPEPAPVDEDSDAAFPSASMAEMASSRPATRPPARRIARACARRLKASSPTRGAAQARRDRAHA